MGKYKILLSDLDNTIFDFSKAEETAVGAVIGKYAGYCTSDLTKSYAEFNDMLWKKLEKNEITRDQLIDVRFVEFFKRNNIDGDGKQAAKDYEKLLSACHYYIDGAEDFLRYCKGKIKVYIISNGTARVQIPRIKASNLESLCDGVFISEIIGYSKPSPKFFEYIEENITGFEKSKTLVFGDSVSADIKGGIAYGLDTCLFAKENVSDVKPTYTVSDFNKLCDILFT